MYMIKIESVESIKKKRLAQMRYTRVLLDTT